ncbi:spermidine/putrescine ABC transporter substrate-binding protein [Natronococcus pandeyae]|uniref:Spermidine/putrescine ABC transporter substrate-binding protein n=1 Tax=Natronococcus pandeyae TaxID=2055836 RepID=A0A8J8TN39_9EURY|nr:extracellular solute-binding protein [Natronococcus pandeyae]TYL36261.1 spermidine/putrescine ABC transporter substrate-binding protein [Natronococcus pandeyae]
MAADPHRDAETNETESVIDSSTTARATSTSRRRFLSATAAGSAAGLAGCAELAGSDADERLSVCVWSGNYADRFEEGLVTQYEDEHDLEIDVQRGWNEILDEIRQAPDDDPPYDVTVAEGNFYYYGRQDDLFEPIDEDNVPNSDEIIDYYAEMRGTEYGLPVDGAPCTIIHREDADVDPESWGDLSSEAVEQSRGIGVDTGFWWYPLYAAAIAMDEAEGAEEMHDEDLHDAVLETVEDWNIQTWAESGEDIWQDFENDVIDVAQWYYDQTAADIDDYDGLTHTMPEQTTGWFNNWCVVKGTDMQDEAEEFINFLLDGDVQTEWAQAHPMVFSNENIEYPEEYADDLPTTTEEAENIAFPDWEYLAEHDSDLDDAFTSIQQSS